ncbi:MAG: hypothetical protein GY940_38170 [bacterium]|nr:hypothetical protein [bacterium]
MSLKKRHDAMAFLALTIVVALIGLVAWPVSSEIVNNTLAKLQISNNNQQADRFKGLIEEKLRKGMPPKEVAAEFQESLSLMPTDESGFVCMLEGEGAEVLCHPRSEMIGRRMAEAVRKDLEGKEITFGKANSEQVAGGGYFNPDEENSQIVYQVPIEGQDWLLSVHSNRDLVKQKADHIMNTLLIIAIPSAILLILVGTVAVRKTSNQYELKLEEANSQLEDKVRERTGALTRNYEILQQTREKLAQSEKMSFIGQLMASITHEINNPLAAIIGNADLLLMKDSLDEKQTRAINRIKVSGDRCSRLVRNLLTFSRNKPLERHKVSLTSIIDTVLKLLETEIQKYGAQININISPDTPGVMVERLQIEQVFQNLVKNAVDAMYESPQKEPGWGSLFVTGLSKPTAVKSPSKAR